MKKKFFQNYTQYEIGLIYHQSITIVSNGSSAVYSAVQYEMVYANEKNQ